MANFLDILTGKFFKFRTATGADIDAGISDKLIVTPESIAHSNAMSNTSIPLVLPSLFTSKVKTFYATTYVFVIPTNGYFFTNKKTKIQAQLFAFAIADKSCKGEICLVDALTNTVVPKTTFSFGNTKWKCVNGGLFEVEAGKIYTIGLRRSVGTGNKLVQLRAATLTLKLLSN